MVKTTGQLKKKAWKLVSEFVRLRDCLKTTGTLEWGHCVTCGKKFSYKALQAGHVIDGRVGMNFLDVRGIFGQCMQCNVWKHGAKDIYIPWFLKEYGPELFDEIMREKRTPCLWKRAEYEAFIEKIKQDIKYIKEL